jgi:hypothetical protein
MRAPVDVGVVTVVVGSGNTTLNCSAGKEIGVPSGRVMLYPDFDDTLGASTYKSSKIPPKGRVAGFTPVKLMGPPCTMVTVARPNWEVSSLEVATTVNVAVVGIVEGAV